MPHILHYKLTDDHQVVPCDVHGLGSDRQPVARLEISAGDQSVLVSTIFIPIDLNPGFDGLPVVFETMIFGGEYDGFQRRYHVWDEAVAGHKEAVHMAQRAVLRHLAK